MPHTYPDARTTGLADPNAQVRIYALSGEGPLVGLLDNPWTPPYIQDAPHRHNVMEIGACLSGSGVVRMGEGGRPIPFDAGTLVVMPAGLVHSQQNEDPHLTHWRYVLVDENRLLRNAPPRFRPIVDRFLRRMRLGALPLRCEPGSSGPMDVINEMYRIRAEEMDAEFELEALLWVLVARLTRTPMSVPEGGTASAIRPSPVEGALAYISEHYAEKVCVRDLAERCAMSESYFRKTFQANMQMAPLEYLNRYRINRAQNLLRMTDETIAAIAAATGFSDAATFNRNFRRYAHSSPAVWRKKGGRGDE